MNILTMSANSAAAVPSGGERMFQAHPRMENLETRKLRGWTVVRLEDQIFATQVTFAEENEPSLLGVVTLEDALLAVDPVRQRLVPVEAERL